MFTSFKSTDDAGDGDEALECPEPVGATARGFMNTACDMCRIKKVHEKKRRMIKCTGNGEKCLYCTETSAACTYALASGKKRKRTAPTASFRVVRPESSREQIIELPAPDNLHPGGHGVFTAVDLPGDDATSDKSFLSGAEFSLCPSKGTGRNYYAANSENGSGDAVATELDSQTSPNRCADSCLPSLLQLLEQLGPVSSASVESPPDCLLLCLETGILRSREVIACCSCKTLVSNPMLLVTILSNLVAVVEKLISLFLECQTPDMVPTVFQFGSYSVRDSKLRTRLLKSWIAMHATDVDGLIASVKPSISGQAEAILNSAKIQADKSRHALHGLDYAMAETV